MSRHTEETTKAFLDFPGESHEKTASKVPWEPGVVGSTFFEQLLRDTARLRKIMAKVILNEAIPFGKYTESVQDSFFSLC